jgi:hypothetical protein
VTTAALAALAVTSSTIGAWAYCRATTCRSDGSCTPPSEECKELRWARSCVGVAVQQSASKDMTLDQVHGVIDAAFGAWQKADCGGGTPGIVVQNLGDVACGDVEYNSKAGNTNVLVFRDGGWPHPNSSQQLALTTVTFNPTTGEIYNADIEVNSADYTFTDVSAVPDDANFGSLGLNDLLSVLTHETGHFLGLAHTTEGEATMFASYSSGSKDDAIKFRSLEQDDITGICDIYPPATIDPAACNPIPRHGFSPDCREAQVVGCSVGRPYEEESDAAPSRAAQLGLLAAAALAAGRRRRARRS